MKRLLLALLWWPVVTLASGHNAVPAPSITVVGFAEAFAKPDMAELEVGVVTQARTASDALKNNNETAGKLLQVMHSLGIAENDIRTQDVSVHPQYQFQGDRSPRVIGFEVKNQVAVKVRNLADLGQLLNQLVAHGGNTLSRVHLGNADPTQLFDEARRQALADAQRKAALYARTAGVRLGRPLLIQESPPHARPPVPLVERQAAMTTAEVPIMPGETSFQVQITVTYAIE